MGRELNDTLIQTSCILSILGSLAVAFTWAFPRSNRTKPGRILLLWLSVTDLLGSMFYFMQTFDNIRNNEVLCKTCALLDIFFPVASFLWTDFIALYLYLVVTARLTSSQLHWDRLLPRFHLVVWTVSTAVLLLVLLFNHAGQEDADDDAFSSNTGGWCWVKAQGREASFVWELIGGKLVEWLSALLISYCYLYVACTVLKVDRAISSIRYASPSTRTLSPLPDASEQLLVSESSYSAFACGASARSSASEGYFIAAPHALSPVGASEGVLPVFRKVEPTASSQDSGRPAARGRRPGLFNRFYAKLSLLPVVFILTRFWSSLRVILKVLGQDAAADNSFLVIMQAVCDPAQGFINALLFVCFSAADRRRLLNHLAYSVKYAAYALSCGMCAAPDASALDSSMAPLLRSANSVQQQNERMSASGRSRDLFSQALLDGSAHGLLTDDRQLSDSGDLIHVEDDFECDDESRLSNFSFDFQSFSA